MKTLLLTYENQYWQQGIKLIAGLDEVGMGALAGPVVAGAVIMDGTEPPKDEKITIRDSKALTAKQREKAAAWIRTHAISWAVAEASIAEITNLNILAAARLAMRRAVEQLLPAPELLLVDGRQAVIHPTIPAECIISGDTSCFSIAAASILAKVHRDDIMRQLDERFPRYGFAAHKGYASRQHLQALVDFGPCVQHRPTYAPVAKLLARA